MKLTIKKAVVLTAAVLSAFVMSGCTKDTVKNAGNGAVSDNTYAFVSKNVQNSYMQKLYQGFDNACREAGASAVYKAPHSYSPQEQADIINELTDAGIKGIAVAANDEDALTESLQRAMSKGVKIVSVDSAVNENARLTHIQQADPEKIGRTLVASAYDTLGGQGGIAILSSTEHATNQNLWVEYMKKEIEENPEKYSSTPLIEITYGDDDMTKSTTETRRLLENPKIKAIIVPTSVGIIAAGNAIREAGSSVKLVGLGMPSQMYSAIEDGICQKMYLWSPIDTGYLAAYTLCAMNSGQLTGASGESFTAGKLGERTVIDDIEGGTQIMLGDLVEFNKANIAEWKDVF